MTASLNGGPNREDLEKEIDALRTKARRLLDRHRTDEDNTELEKLFAEISERTDTLKKLGAS